MKSFKEVLAEAQRIGPKKVAVAGEPNEELVEALQQTSDMGIGEAVAFDTANEAALAVRDGLADVLMKGSVDSASFMRAVLAKEHDFRTGKLISHVFVAETRGRLLIVTDAGVCIAPSLEEKAEIIANAVPVARRLGAEVPKVAVLAAIEKVNPKMPTTVEAAKLSEMDIPGCVVQGPLALDLAVSLPAAETKGVSGPVAGQADIMLTPNLETGNILAKSMMYFADLRTGGLVAGTKRPVTFSSRSDTVETKLNTIALGVLMCDA
ncbi:MAG: phosphate acyltransferase [Planctomycetota bacterium]|jgi:phosphate butyryltransferase